ncbi:MAG: AEC family transporter, partial [Candidatus Sumerlaeaceae bacterium]|nr:AEC family transporter [Candidatus Sumerlaeaceae bacterium]
MDSFLATLGAVISVFAIGACGFWARRSGTLSHQGLSELARLLIDFLLPASLFHSMFSQFDPHHLEEIAQPAVTQVVLLLAGGIPMAICWRVLQLRVPRGTALALASFQNNVYLPLPIAVALVPPSESLKAQFYVGCFVLFFTPTLWSFGVMLLAGPHKSPQPKPTWKLALNPPFLGALSGIVAKLIMGHWGLALPQPVTHFLTLMGNGTVPIAMVVLGGLLAEVRSVWDVDARAIWTIVWIKLVFVPLCILLFLMAYRHGDPVFRLVLM